MGWFPEFFPFSNCLGVKKAGNLPAHPLSPFHGRQRGYFNFNSVLALAKQPGEVCPTIVVCSSIAVTSDFITSQRKCRSIPPPQCVRASTYCRQNNLLVLPSPGRWC
ncbi:hypothetical protein AVEN_72895-1 [Araneus ventricosus]|uniref:Uncharacterized protein n=1 Tax=Araneus ventricosus TaxID=182803 RepID=A0A4Y2KKG4_ARAVE|nr:hypothetical protein AVEN_72895-1 [Araneus ventricosus]